MLRPLLRLQSSLASSPARMTMSTVATNTCTNPALGFKSKHLAAGTVPPKTDPAQVTFYNMRFCPYAQRTALVLMAKNIP